MEHFGAVGNFVSIEQCSIFPWLVPLVSDRSVRHHGKHSRLPVSLRSFEDLIKIHTRRLTKGLPTTGTRGVAADCPAWYMICLWHLQQIQIITVENTMANSRHGMTVYRILTTCTGNGSSVERKIKHFGHNREIAFKCSAFECNFTVGR